MAGDLSRFCDLMYTACAVWSLGYDQSNRQDIRDGGECDCSSLVIWALARAGFDVGGASYTGNLSAALTARGWLRIAPDTSICQPGDILLNDQCHVCAVVSGHGRQAMVAQASIDERGRISGGQPGDQTGGETNVRQVYVYSRGWDCILRWSGAGAEAPAPGESAAALAVDGWAGPLTVAEWQRQVGTTADGVVSGQPWANRQYLPNLASVEWGLGGSMLARAVQRRAQVAEDGCIGPETVRGIQRWLDTWGCGLSVDGYLGPRTAKALQRTLNDGRWRA